MCCSAFPPGVPSSLTSSLARTTCHDTTHASPPSIVLDRRLVHGQTLRELDRVFDCSSQELRLGPGSYLQSALRTGARDSLAVTIRGHDPCHGASAVPESTRALPVTASSEGGTRGRRLRVCARDPRHVAAAVPWYVVTTVTAPVRVEDEADHARNVPYRNLTVSACSDSVC